MGPVSKVITDTNVELYLLVCHERAFLENELEMSRKLRLVYSPTAKVSEYYEHLLWLSYEPDDYGKMSDRSQDAYLHRFV